MFQPYFTAPTFQHALVLGGRCGPGPGKRTVTQVLRGMSLAERVGLARNREVQNRAHSDARDCRMPSGGPGRGTSV